MVSIGALFLSDFWPFYIELGSILGERAHGSGNETQEHVLVRRKNIILWLPLLGKSLELRVCSEVHTLVSSLPEGSERDSAVQSTETLLADDGVQSVRSIAVLWHVERVSHRVALGL